MLLRAETYPKHLLRTHRLAAAAQNTFIAVHVPVLHHFIDLQAHRAGSVAFLAAYTILGFRLQVQ
ncbi:hypothetical protein D3C87_2152970 [compost metagenome]